MALYKVRPGVSISGDLHEGDVFDSEHERFKNHDLPFLENRGDIVKASDEDKKRHEDLVAAPGLAKRIADAQEAAVPEGFDGEAEPGAGDHDVLIQQTRGDALQPREVVEAENAEAEAVRKRERK